MIDTILKKIVRDKEETEGVYDFTMPLRFWIASYNNDKVLRPIPMCGKKYHKRVRLIKGMG